MSENERLQKRNEGNEHMISELKGRIGREKDLEEISKYYEYAHKSLAKKYRALEGQLQVAREWFENEAKLVQQLHYSAKNAFLPHNGVSSHQYESIIC